MFKGSAATAKLYLTEKIEHKGPMPSNEDALLLALHRHAYKAELTLGTMTDSYRKEIATLRHTRRRSTFEIAIEDVEIKEVAEDFGNAK